MEPTITSKRLKIEQTKLEFYKRTVEKAPPFTKTHASFELISDDSRTFSLAWASD